MDKWVMVSHDDYTWRPRRLLADLGEVIDGRYICACADNPGRWQSWDYMRPAKARELLPMLPDGWRELAVKRCGEFPQSPGVLVTTLYDALTQAFIWGGTPEGHAAWSALYRSIIEDTPLPPVPVTKRTARDWLNNLPDGWRELAIRRCEEFPNVPYRKVEMLHDAIDWAFVWKKTPEGMEEWKGLHDALCDGTPLPPVPQEKPEPEPKPRTIKLLVSNCCGAQVRSSKTIENIGGNTGIKESDICCKCENICEVEWVTVQAVDGEVSDD